MQFASEQLISDVTKYIMTLVPIHTEKTKNELSMILANYHIQKVESDETHPDLREKTQLYLSAKKIRWVKREDA